jgi:hypothetical protein
VSHPAVKNPIILIFDQAVDLSSPRKQSYWPFHIYTMIWNGMNLALCYMPVLFSNEPWAVSFGLCHSSTISGFMRCICCCC